MKLLTESVPFALAGVSLAIGYCLLNVLGIVNADGDVTSPALWWIVWGAAGMGAGFAMGLLKRLVFPDF